MRKTILTFCAGVGLLAVAGCAQNEKRDPAISATPAGYELPWIPQAEDQHIVDAQVEGAWIQPRARLAPDFVPPEPTPEEQAILGEPPEYVYLPYPVPGIAPNSRVYSGLGGAETAAHGRGRAESLTGPAYPDNRAYGGRGGASTAASSFPAGVGGVGHARPTAGAAGSREGGAETATDSQASKIAQERETAGS